MCNGVALGFGLGRCECTGVDLVFVTRHTVFGCAPHVMSVSNSCPMNATYSHMQRSSTGAQQMSLCVTIMEGG
jgi:hypothetical protein